MNHDFESLLRSACQALREGKPILVADSRQRENEVDAIAAAQHVDGRVLAWMIRHTSGYICAAMTSTRATELKLPPMVADNQDPRRTNYMVTCDAASRVTTGISAADRARTLRVLADPSCGASDLIRPGHMVPLVAQPGGVLVRGGHTETAVDMCRLAGLTQVGALAELVNDDGTMMRYEQAASFAEQEGLVLITVDDLAQWRKEHDNDSFAELELDDGSRTSARLDGLAPSRSIAEDARGVAGERSQAQPEKTKAFREEAAGSGLELIAQAELPTDYGRFQVRCYRETNTGIDHLALISETESQAGVDPLVRVHSECLTGEALGSLRCDCGPQLQTALEMISRQGGAVIYMRGHEGRGIGLAEKIRAYQLQDEGLDTAQANIELGWPIDMREYHAAAEILADLGFHHVRLLTNNPQKRRLDPNLVTVTEMVPLQVGVTAENVEYLRTKQKLGHLLADLPQ